MRARARCVGWSARFRIQDGTDQSTDHRKLGKGTGRWGKKKTAVKDHLLDLSQQALASESSKESHHREKVMQAQKWGSQGLGSFGRMDETNTLDGEDNSTLFLWSLFPP